MKLSHLSKAAALASALIVGSVMPRASQAQWTHEPAVKNIVLVHGAWADGSCWSKVIVLLEAKGFHVVAVQNPLTSLPDDVAATQRALAALDGPAILVGHSYGGTVITQAGVDPKVAGAGVCLCICTRHRPVFPDRRQQLCAIASYCGIGFGGRLLHHFSEGHLRRLRPRSAFD